MNTRPISSVRPHPDNARIYGDDADTDLIESIKAKGILTALLVTHDDRIISGHRRYLAAVAAGLQSVPVTVFGSRDEDDILEALVHANKGRTKSPEQVAREVQTLWEVERRRADARAKATQAKPGEKADIRAKAILPEPCDAGQTRDKVGAALGISGKKAEQMKRVADAIDDLANQGRAQEAEVVRKTLVDRSVNAACKVAEAIISTPPPEDDEPDPEPSADVAHLQIPDDVLDAIPLFDEATASLRDLRKRIQTIADSPAGGPLRRFVKSKGEKVTVRELVELAELINQSRPHAAGCPNCPGNVTACVVCQGRGWLSRRDYDQLTPALREKVRVLE